MAMAIGMCRIIEDNRVAVFDESCLNCSSTMALGPHVIPLHIKINGKIITLTFDSNFIVFS